MYVKILKVTTAFASGIIDGATVAKISVWRVSGVAAVSCHLQIQSLAYVRQAGSFQQKAT